MLFYVIYDATEVSVCNRENKAKEDYFSHSLGRYAFDLSPLHQGRERRFFFHIMRRIGLSKEKAQRAWDKVLHGLKAKEHVDFTMAH